jgi:hypothetical protein
MNGTVGFRVELADGRVVTELDGTWDDVPHGVLNVSLCSFPSGRLLCGLDGCERYFFSNEAVSDWNGRSTLVAKILGGVKEGQALVMRLVLDQNGNHRVEHAVLQQEQLPFVEHVYRNA